METTKHAKADVYIQLRKADNSGNLLQNLNIPLSDLGALSVEKVPLLSSLKYLGPEGLLRASYRDVAEGWSKPHWKTLSHKKEVPFCAKEVVRLEIDIWPTGILFQPEEKLVLKISGHPMSPVDFESLQGTFSVTNQEEHVIFWGGKFPSYLEIPVVDIM